MRAEPRAVRGAGREQGGVVVVLTSSLVCGRKRKRKLRASGLTDSSIKWGPNSLPLARGLD